MPFVLDSSVSTGWFVTTQADDYSRAVAHALEQEHAWVPALWLLEQINVLRTACLRGRIDAARAHDILGELQALPITVATQVPVASEILALALRHGLTSYDATYLDLAMLLRLPLATRDADLRLAAMACGVGIWNPDAGR